MAVKGRHGATLAGRYRLLEQLGEGGMGSVWKAEHLLLHSHVAVKLIDPDVARLEFNLARFLREAKTLASLRSPHVVQVLDFGTDVETPYLVMELLQGETLGRRLSKRGRLSLNETCRVLEDVCAAMSLVHEQGLVHRDLKPDNIFLCDVAGQRVAKVVDFGIAKSLRGDMSASMKTRTGHMLGTPSYMSPEQCRGMKDIDHRADLWALGVIAYECLVGKVPFEGQALGDLLLRICMDPLPIPSQHARGALPGDFDAWFAKAVARDRSLRFQSALELATSLSDLSPSLGGPAREPVEASRPSVPRISFVPPAPATRQPSTTQTNTSVGLVGASLRLGASLRGERRAPLAAAVGAAFVALIALWGIAGRPSAEAGIEVDIESSRAAYEVAPKVIRSAVPSGRRWQPNGGTPSGGAVLDGDAGDGAGVAAAGADLGASDLGASDLGASDLGASDLGASDLGGSAVSALPLGAGAQAGAATTASPAALRPLPQTLLPRALLPGSALASTAANSGAGAASNGAGSATLLAATGSAGADIAKSHASVNAGPKGVAAPGGGSGSSAGSAATPPAASPVPPRPSHGRQLGAAAPPSKPPLLPLRGTAATPTPSRARSRPSPGDDTIRHTR